MRKARRNPSNPITVSTLLALAIITITLIPLNITFAVSHAVPSDHDYPQGSWGLGVVVPEGSELADGGHVSWASTKSVSVVFTLPNITFTDAPILAVVSLMAADGSVMQVAAGLYPNNTKWLSYGWYIGNVQAYPQTYAWVLNSSEPEMSAQDQVALGISMSQSGWRYYVENLNSHAHTVGEYTFNVSPTIKAGDQEVFALESYSTSNVVFAQMGNMTLTSLRINGKNIKEGWYPYGSWDTHHNPLFVVGGLNPPSYMALQKGQDSTLVWRYQPWTGPSQTHPPTSLLTILIGTSAVAAIGVSLLGFVLKRRTRSISKCHSYSRF